MANRSVLRAAIRLCNASDEPTRQEDNFSREIIRSNAERTSRRGNVINAPMIAAIIVFGQESQTYKKNFPMERASRRTFSSVLVR